MLYLIWLIPIGIVFYILVALTVMTRVRRYHIERCKTCKRTILANHQHDQEWDNYLRSRCATYGNDIVTQAWLWVLMPLALLVRQTVRTIWQLGTMGSRTKPTYLVQAEADTRIATLEKDLGYEPSKKLAEIEQPEVVVAKPVIYGKMITGAPSYQGAASYQSPVQMMDRLGASSSALAAGMMAFHCGCSCHQTCHTCGKPFHGPNDFHINCADTVDVEMPNSYQTMMENLKPWTDAAGR